MGCLYRGSGVVLVHLGSCGDLEGRGIEILGLMGVVSHLLPFG